MKRASIAVAAAFLAMSIAAEATVKPSPKDVEANAFRGWFQQALGRINGKQLVAEATDRARTAFRRIEAAGTESKLESASGQAAFLLDIAEVGGGTDMQAAMPEIYSAFAQMIDGAKLLPTYDVAGSLVLYAYIKSQYGNSDGGKHVITEPEQLAIDKITRRLLAGMTHDAYRWNLLYGVYQKLPSAVDDEAQRMKVVAALHSGAQRMDP